MGSSAGAVRRVAMQVFDLPKESVRIMITEHPKTHYAIGGKTALALGR